MVNRLGMVNAAARRGDCLRNTAVNEMGLPGNISPDAAAFTRGSVRIVGSEGWAGRPGIAPEHSRGVDYMGAEPRDYKIGTESGVVRKVTPKSSGSKLSRNPHRTSNDGAFW